MERRKDKGGIFGLGILTLKKEEQRQAFGILVKIIYITGIKETLHNVTEIHFGYETLMARKRIAFESNIHSTGVTHYVDEIQEFEAFPETEIAPEF